MNELVVACQLYGTNVHHAATEGLLVIRGRTDRDTVWFFAFAGTRVRVGMAGTLAPQIRSPYLPEVERVALAIASCCFLADMPVVYWRVPICVGWHSSA